MGAHKQSISITNEALTYAKELVVRGSYPNVGVAVSDVLGRTRALRECDVTPLGVEVECRLELPLDQWESVASAAELTADARSFLDGLDLENRSGGK